MARERCYSSTGEKCVSALECSSQGYCLLSLQAVLKCGAEGWPRLFAAFLMVAVSFQCGGGGAVCLSCYGTCWRVVCAWRTYSVLCIKFSVVLRFSCYLHFHFQMVFGCRFCFGLFFLVGLWFFSFFLVLTVCLILLPFSFSVIFPHLGSSLTYSVFYFESSFSV